MIVAQLIAGAAWGAILMSAFTVAFAIGANGGEGRMSGLLFSTLALATLARMATVATGMNADPAFVGALRCAAGLVLGGGRRGPALSGGRRRAAMDVRSVAARMTRDAMADPTEIAVRARTVGQLFNSLDPSPFREKDLDAGVEEFLVGWVRELPAAAPFTIAVHLPPEEAAKPDAARIGEAFAHYFHYRAQVAEQERRELFRIGRRSLAIGLVVLAACLVASQTLAQLLPNEVAARVLEESLIIVGWVANWRPIEIYLYDWLPIRRRIKLFERIAAAKVEVKAG